MSEFSTSFNTAGFNDYPRSIQGTIDYVAVNANVANANVNDVYSIGPNIPVNPNLIWVHLPPNLIIPPSLRRNVSGEWLEFSSINRGDIIIAPDSEVIVFPWGESGETYDLSVWGEPNFTVPVLPSPPAGFQYKYYIGARVGAPTPPSVSP